MKRLSEREFLQSASWPLKQLPPEAAPPFDFWSYFESIPLSDFEGHDCSAGRVSYVWEDSNGRYQWVNVNSDDNNVFMVLVLDLKEGTVIGHRLLNLNREYQKEDS